MIPATRINRLVDFYETLTPESVRNFAELYSQDVFFKDPFNEVRGLEALRGIFMKMFEKVSEPRFIVTERVVDEQGAVLVWEFHFRIRQAGCGGARIIRGVSHLKFDPDGRVNWHRDYWDAAEEFYAGLPVIGLLFSGLRKMMAG